MDNGSIANIHNIHKGVESVSKEQSAAIAEKCMELENIMVNEINQTPMVRSIMFSVWKKSEGEKRGKKESSRK